MKYTVAPEMREDVIGTNRSQSMIKAVSGGVQRIEKEWNSQCAFITAGEDGTEGKKNMMIELNLVRSKIEKEVQASLSEMEEEMIFLEKDIVGRRLAQIGLEVTPHDTKMLDDGKEEGIEGETKPKSFR